MTSRRHVNPRAALLVAVAAASVVAAAAPALAADRVYWTNAFSDQISHANLDGPGEGGQLSIAGATPGGTGVFFFGVAIDPAAGRLYWANQTKDKISYTNLDGSGGGDLETVGATVEAPTGVAIDPNTGRIYWANYHGISYANLDGSGGGDLETTGATVNDPSGVAIDPAAGRIYWANFLGSSISYANLDGSGEGGDLSTTGATATGAFTFPALLKAPGAAGAPTITGNSTPGSLLSCSQGSWAADLFSDFLFQAPYSYAYTWQLNGADIPGAGATSFTATRPGLYSCRVTATNQAGSTPQTSAQLQVISSQGGSQQNGSQQGASQGSSSQLVSTTVAAIAKLTGLSETNAIFAPARASTTLNGQTAKRHRSHGTTFSFSLDQAATVTVQIQRKGVGRRVRHTCKPAGKSLRRKPKCTLYTTATTLKRTGHAGLNKLAFTGRIGGKALKPGSYQAVFEATNAAGTSRAQAIAFVVVAR
jgi:hypothetical protein